LENLTDTGVEARLRCGAREHRRLRLRSAQQGFAPAPRAITFRSTTDSSSRRHGPWLSPGNSSRMPRTGGGYQSDLAQVLHRGRRPPLDRMRLPEHDPRAWGWHWCWCWRRRRAGLARTDIGSASICFTASGASGVGTMTTLTCIGPGGVSPGPVSSCPMLSRYFGGVRS
jgi:hypothetical protein